MRTHWREETRWQKGLVQVWQTGDVPRWVAGFAPAGVWNGAGFRKSSLERARARARMLSLSFQEFLREDFV
jgi:hypothetical protein